MIFGVLAMPLAHAAPAAPSGLSPNGTSVSANPVLSWSRVRAAISYDVEVSATSDFADPLYAITTTNQRATPTAQLPMSKIWWRVRTRTSSGASGWATASFTRNKLAGPSLREPANGATLAQPTQPPLLRWEPVAGATSYQVEIDRGDEADWVDTQTYSTQTTSLVVPDPQENGQYWWRVRAEVGAGQSTHPSPAWLYKVGPLPVIGPSTLSVADEVTKPLQGENIEEVVFDWEPVSGAVSYDIRVSTDDSFSKIIDSRVVLGSRYSPTKTYDVDDYWWQVRARNIFGKAQEWTEVRIRHFHRSWEGTGAVPKLLYPANTVSPSVGDDFYYQWTPARLATRYRLDVGSDQNFSPGTFVSCFTTQTTYAPGFVKSPVDDNCMPGVGVTHFWRVKALDAPSTEIQGVYSSIGKFVYSPDQVPQISPLTGSTVDIPTLRWEPALDADKYFVEIKWSGGSRSATTYSTSWTPTGTSKLDPSKGPFTWTVQAIDHHGVKTPLPVFGAGQTFEISGQIPTTGAAPLTPLAPQAGAAATPRFPELAWEPVEGAAYYKVWVGTAGSGYVEQLGSQFPYPAGTDISQNFLSAGKYDWFAAAYDSSGALIGGGPGTTGTFTIRDLPLATGQKVALDGSGFAAGATPCAKALTNDPSNVCSQMTATPVLDWEPVQGAGYYMVYLSRDRNFQNMVYGSYSDSSKIPTTTNTRWTPTEALPDSQAGVAYYWYIRPCKAPGNCSPDPLKANHAFDKRSNPVETLAPLAADGEIPHEANDVTFRWADYLSTNQKSTNKDPATSEQAGQAARTYHLQVGTSQAFTTLVDEVTVDQTTYTAFTKMYPEGDLWWRVQAMDGSNNGLAWSTARPLKKVSEVPKQDGPSGSTTTTEPFRWSATPFAASYDLEVYRNGDTAASSTNRVVSVNSKQVAYTLTKPLPGGTTYVWRVRRVDASKNKGRWSGWSSFQVGGGAPSLKSPASGAWVSSKSALFSWNGTSDATSYLFERRAAGSTRNTETVKTASTAWAPDRSIPTGKWEWRVSSLDAAGKIIRSSGWRSFGVDATGPTILRVSPSGYSVKPGASFKIKFSEPVKNVSGTTVRLFKYGAKKKVRARVTLSSDRRVATLNPAANLRRGTYYTIKLSGSITDRFGNPMRPYEKRIRTR
jgi:hypothetical protein